MRDFLWKYFRVDVYWCGKHIVLNRIFGNKEFILTTMWLGIGKEVNEEYILPTLAYNFGFGQISWTDRSKLND